MTIRTILASGLALAVAPAAAWAQASDPGGGSTIDPDGTVVVPSFKLPPSLYTSDEARAKLPRQPTDQEEPMYQALAAGKAPEMRSRVGEIMAARLEPLKQAFGVTTRSGVIAGVPTVTVTPAGGVPAGNRGKVLIDLPGGGFVMGTANGTGMLESIPLASLAKVEIVSISYRQAPEHAFPAASEDVAKVYRELLKTHKPQDIGIFGCSAGGLLAAEAVAWFVKENLPLPGAIGIFCASADARWGGDSRAYARPFQAIPPRDGPRNYFKPGDETNPLASPVLAPDVLARFPPTLLITATRAAELSSAVNTHRELVKAGVEGDLHVWDGLGHAFFYDAGLPESREAFEVQANFFRKHLKLAR
ncbi:MAG: alpha/beta hydrolase fold domain-containing protein [Novosphingobium sp.]